MSSSRSEMSRFIAIFASGTMLSRVFGLLRDMAMAALVPRPVQEIFIFAFRFPNMLRDMLGEGAVNAAFVPIMTEVQEKEGTAALKELVRACLSAMLLIFGFLTFAGILLADFVPGLTDIAEKLHSENAPAAQQLALTISVVRWIMPYFIFIGLTAFLMAPLYVLGHYSTPSWTPVLLNISLLCAMWWGKNYMEDPTWALVAGVWIGGVAQLAIMYHAATRLLGVIAPSLRLRHPGLLRACWLLGPVIIGQSAGEVNKLVDGFVAYSLGEMSTLWYANRLIQLPLSIFGVAIGVAILPAISRAHVAQDAEALRETLKSGFRQCIFLVTPAMAGMLVMREPIVRLLFEHGQFSPADTVKTASAVLYLGAGLLIFALIRVGVQGFYAIQNTHTPVMAASVSMIINIALIFVLAGPMGFRGLALATTLAYGVNFAVLYFFLWRRFGALWDRALTTAVLSTGIAALALCLACHGLHAGFAYVLDTTVLAFEIVSVLAPLGLAGGAYLLVSHWLRVPEWLAFQQALTRRGNARNS
ncbi:MAG: murein biosynthesis integral membrane protein MurJ [Candidatus Hydrogenedentes bacterium]|nr:murein biosynthesis integral membrane protein MurJ [Candidatus Hydrogenedentota bacterium]